MLPENEVNLYSISTATWLHLLPPTYSFLITIIYQFYFTLAFAFGSPNRRISFGRSMTVEDLNSPRYSLSNGGSEDDLCKATTSTNSKLLLDASLLSSNPSDMSFHSNQDLYKSTTKMYSWNYLEGNGRYDSNVDSAWIHKDIEVGHDLMSARNRAIQENGGLTEPYEKLLVNFVFLIESDHQTRGLHAEVEDETWDALCEATRDEVEPLPKDVVDEVLVWVHLLAQENPDSFRKHLRQSPPKDPTLQSILNLMVNNGQLWSNQSCNEDTYLKSWLGPFLETYFGNIRFVATCWTQTQQETRIEDSDLLVPDFVTITKARHRDLSIVLLEGKVTSNTSFQIWDDNVQVVGILVQGIVCFELDLVGEGESCGTFKVLSKERRAIYRSKFS